MAVDSSLIERVQGRFLSSPELILKINHLSHDYHPVMHKLGLVFLANIIVVVDLLSQISFKVSFRQTRSSTFFVITSHNTN